MSDSRAADGWRRRCSDWARRLAATTPRWKQCKRRWRRWTMVDDLRLRMLDDLLTAERNFRDLAEKRARALTGVLTELAYRLAGRSWSEMRRLDCRLRRAVGSRRYGAVSSWRSRSPRRGRLGQGQRQPRRGGNGRGGDCCPAGEDRRAGAGTGARCGKGSMRCRR